MRAPEKAITRSTVMATHKRSVDVFNNRDAEAVAAVYAADAVVYDPLCPEPLRGRDAIRQDYAALFSSFPDILTTILNVFVDGDTITYEMRLSGTNQGPLITSTGKVPATNRRVAWPVAVFADADAANLYREVRRYYDVTNLMEQLGLDT